MKNLPYVLMGIGFITAGLSMVLSYGQGFHAWVWQLNCIIWVADGFIKQRHIDRLTNKLEK